MANSAHNLLSASFFSKQISNGHLIASLVFQFATACEFPYSSVERLGRVWALAAQMWPLLTQRTARWLSLQSSAVSSWYKLSNLMIFNCLAWMSTTCACVLLQCPWLSVQINAAPWSSASISFPVANVKLYWSFQWLGEYNKNCYEQARSHAFAFQNNQK